MTDPAIDSIVERMLTDPAFRDLLARDAQGALQSYDLDPVWQRAFQEAARSEPSNLAESSGVQVEPGEALEGHGRAIESPSHKTVKPGEWESEGDSTESELERKERERDQEALEEAISEQKEAAQGAKEHHEQALRLILESIARRTQATGHISGGGGSSGVQNPDASEGGGGAEGPEEADRRSAERLRHRGRGVSVADFERLVLEEFPVIGRAAVVAGVVVALVLSVWMLAQIRGPRGPRLPDSEKDEKVSESNEDPEGQGAAEVTPSLTAPPPTSTPMPAPVMINFNADSYSVERGECTMLRWSVENADRVMVRGAEVEHIEAEEVCPGETRGYRLLAERGVEEDSAYLEIEVTEPTNDLEGSGCEPGPENNNYCP